MEGRLLDRTWRVVALTFASPHANTVLTLSGRRAAEQRGLLADHTGQLGENGPLTRSATIRRYLVFDLETVEEL